MRLRHRLQDDLRARLALHLPDAMATAWDHQAVLVAIEKLDFKPAGGWRDGWAWLTAFTGVVRAELRGDDVDALPVEALIADLIRNPVTLLPENVAPGEMTEAGRADLVELRDTLRDMDVVSGLRFAVQGHILGRATDPGRPDAPMLGEAPEIGPGHQGGYRPMGG